MPRSSLIIQHQRSTSLLQQDRLPQLDAAKTIAIFGIIWIHSARSVEMMPAVAKGRFAVPFFVAAAVLMILRGFCTKPNRSLRRFTTTRLYRLGLPFIAWTIIYLLFKLAKQIVAPGQANDFPGWEILFLGSAYHLWFLPYLIVVSLLVGYSARFVVRVQRPALWGFAAATAALGWACTPYPGKQIPWDGLHFMWLATPAVFSAYAIFLFLQCRRDWWQHRSLIQITSALVLIGSTLFLTTVGRHGFAETLAGVSFLLLTLQWSAGGVVAQRLAQLAPLTYGIYLSHLLFIKVGESVAQRMEVPLSPASDLVLLTFAVWGSISLTWLLSLSGKTRWLIG